jgi:hypothetical protein
MSAAAERAGGFPASRDPEAPAASKADSSDSSSDSGLEAPARQGQRQGWRSGAVPQSTAARLALGSALAFIACVAGFRIAEDKFLVATTATPKAAGPTNSVTRLHSVATARWLKSEATCMDAQGWANGDNACLSNGYDGPGCSEGGLTCDAYEAHRAWCDDAAYSGEATNYPELNCCACGGGTAYDAVLGSTEEAAGSLVQLKSPAAHCVVHESCTAQAEAGQKNCCPNDDGDMMDCCEGKGECVSDDSWANGFIACANQLTEEDGCTAGGLTCKGYVTQGYCKDGAAVEGMEDFLGGSYNHPELHCCECGKIEGSLANVIWD